MQPAPPVFRPLAAALWMGGSITSFTLIAVAGRSLKDHHDVFEIMAYRSLIGVLVLLAIALAFGRRHEIMVRDLSLHALRAVIHYAGQGLWLWALMLIPLAQLFALEFTTPLWVMARSPLFLAEAITRRKLTSGLIGFAGVLVVARPDLSQIDPGVLAALASALCFAFNILFTKRLTQLGTSLNILFWLTFFQLLIGLAVTLHDGHIALPTPASLPWLAIVGLGALSAHFALTKALSLAPASFVMQIDFLRLPLIALVGVALYDEPLTLWLALGAGLILLANWLNLRAPR